MTTWSVVKDDTREKQRPGRYFRYGILASVAVLVISLGLALTPATPPEPPEPAFSEQARAAALRETMQLRHAGRQLADGASGTERQALLQSVTLLTTQARALTGPDQATGANAGAPPTAPSAASPSPSPESPSPASPAALVSALAASGGQRLADAAAADGGMARLLAAVGTAQLLQASQLAPSAGVAAPALPEAAAAASPASCQSSGASRGPGGGPSPAAESSGNASLAAALAMTVKTEAETVYGYQVALARLEGGAATAASHLLARHETVVGEAEALSRAHCVDIPPREAGYTLGPLFIESPAAGLGSLEAGTLPVYGDLVALSQDGTRQWAISGLLAAANRSALWGADAGPLPGIVVDTAQLPQLPDGDE